MKKESKIFGVIALCLFGFFSLIKLILSQGKLVTLDYHITQYMVAHHSEWPFDLMYFISFFASTTFVIIFSLLLITHLYLYQKKKELWSYILTLFPGVIIGFFFKYLIQRARPENLLESDYSFPSLHATASVLLYGWLAFYYWKQGKEKKAYAFMILPVLIGFSRIYLGVHWFSDVLGGFFLGASWMLIVHYGEKEGVKEKVMKFFSKKNVNK